MSTYKRGESKVDDLLGNCCLDVYGLIHGV
jgi:hypothetical protein